MTPPIKIISIVSAALFCLPSTSYAGKLSDFKEDIKNEQRSSSSNSTRVESHDDDSAHFLDYVGFALHLGDDEQETTSESPRLTPANTDTAANTDNETVANTDNETEIDSKIADENSFMNAGVRSFTSVYPTPDEYNPDGSPVVKRELGSALLPFVRFDVASQYIDDIDVLDYRAEIGYGPIALHYNRTEFEEEASGDDSSDSMTINRYHGVYRMTLTPNIELGVGLGLLQIDDDDIENEMSLYIPVLMHVSDHVNCEFQYGYTESIEDVDLALAYSPGFISLKLGYRMLMVSKSDLGGPYAGVALHF